MLKPVSQNMKFRETRSIFSRNTKLCTKETRVSTLIMSPLFLHPSCPTSLLSCLSPVLHTYFPASILFHSYLLPYCPASMLSMLHPILPPSVMNFFLSWIPSVLLSTCPAYILCCPPRSCLSTVLPSSCPASIKFNTSPVPYPLSPTFVGIHCPKENQFSAI